MVEIGRKKKEEEINVIVFLDKPCDSEIIWKVVKSKQANESL